MSIEVNHGARGTTYTVRWRDPGPRERTFRTRRQAESFERQVLVSLDEGTYRDPSFGKLTFADWHARWWPTVQDREPATLAQYESILRHHVLPYLGHRCLRSLRRIDLEEWIAALRSGGLGASAVRTARVLAGMVLGSAVDSHVLPANPIAGLRVPKPPSTVKRALTAAQVEALVGAFEPHYRPLVLVLAYGGLRPGEAAALRRRHFDDLGQLLVEAAATEVRGHWREGDTKTHRARVMPLPASVAAEATTSSHGR